MVQQQTQQQTITDPLAKMAADIFVKYQDDWFNFNLTSMQTYMTPNYLRYNQLMLGALHLLKRQDHVTDLIVNSSSIISNANGRLKVQVVVSGTDQIIDSRTNTTLFNDQQTGMSSYYNFVDDNGAWKLDSIDPSTADAQMQNAELTQFAKNHGYFYALDWGWLLLPQRGVLFNAGAFGTSDINNYVIGQLASTEQIQLDATIFQLYNYIESPNVSPATNYLIAQVATQKDYGDALVREKTLLGHAPSGMAKMSTEWNQFNRKYEVFASDIEKVSALELLNPKFMEELADAKFAINIEVADNVLYFYAKNVQISAENYVALLQLLQEAFREMNV